MTTNIVGVTSDVKLLGIPPMLSKIKMRNEISVFKPISNRYIFLAEAKYW